MKSKLLISCFGLLFLSSCGLSSAFKIYDAFDSEHMSSKAFVEEFPFQYTNGVIVIQAEVQGHLRNFILDTGATTKLNKEFAETLKTESLGKLKTIDSNNNKTRVHYVKLEKIKIANESFYDIVASVSDMKHLNTVACLDVSGIIGANLMNKCIWQIDYQKKKITFTNSRDSLIMSGAEKKIDFSATGKGVPTISLYSNGLHWGDAIFDTGSNGRITVDEKYLDVSSNFIDYQIYSFAMSSTKVKSQKVTSIESVYLSNKYSLDSQLISFESNQPYGIIGNRFLQDYIVTMDWRYQQILLERAGTISTNPNKNFGCSPRFVNDNKVIIGSIRTNSKAYKKGIRLNDQVLSINGISFNNNTHESYCKYLNERDDWERFELIVQKENKELSVGLERTDILEILGKIE